MSKKISSHEAKTYNIDICSAFAVFWNLSLQKMLKEIIKDFENFLISTETPRMQFNLEIPSFTLKLKNHQHAFHQQKFAPPELEYQWRYCD